MADSDSQAAPADSPNTEDEEEEDEEHEEEDDEEEEDEEEEEDATEVPQAKAKWNNRHDPPGLIPKPPPNWKLEARGVVTVVKDSASAASIAARNIFCFRGGPSITAAEIERAKKPYDPDVDTVEYREITCHVHASKMWVSKSKLFVPFKKLYSIADVKKLFQKDLDTFMKNIPFKSIKPFALSLFKEKWHRIGQKAAVDGWLASWGKLRITRVEANEPDASPLRGGIPCDNNALESGNNVDKVLLHREKCAVSEFVDKLGRQIVGPTSAADVQFNHPLKERSKSCKSAYNKAPNNAKFFKHVWDRFQIHKKNPTAPHTISSMTSIKFGVPNHPRGMYWFLSDHGIDRVTAEMKTEGANDDDTATEYDPTKMSEVMCWMKKHNNWTSVIESLMKNPEYTVNLTTMTYDDLQEWCESFHVFIPIKMSPTDDWSHPTNMAVLHWCEMLRMSGIHVLAAEEIAKRKKKPKECLFACTCEMYLHYIICKHTLQLYLKSGIVTFLPKGGTPMIKRGKKRKAHGGEALTFDV